MATPAPFNVPDPKLVAPSKKSTGPVGVPLEAVTVAVNVTGWKKLNGFEEEVTTVVVVVAATAGFTT